MPFPRREKWCEAVAKKETQLEYAADLETVNEDLSELSEEEAEFLPITTKTYLYLSGTPFRALSTGEFIEEQIFNWTYTDEQRAREAFAGKNPGKWTPYGALPQMRLFTYQMPDELLAIASAGEFDEFDLNEFFAATGTGATAEFKHKNDVQKWLDIIRGSYVPTQVDNLKLGNQRPPPLLRRTPSALPSALVLVPAEGGCMSRHGEPAGRKAQHVLARLHRAHRRRRVGRGRAGCSATSTQGDRERVRHEDNHALVRQADDRSYRPAVVVDLDAAQPQVARDVLSGSLPGPVTVVDQEPQR